MLGPSLDINTETNVSDDQCHQATGKTFCDYMSHFNLTINKNVPIALLNKYYFYYFIYLTNNLQ